jgi:small-conductance mechanosensitive channel
MHDYIANNLINRFVPELIYELPILGVIDVTKLLAALTIFFGLTFIFWLIRKVVLVRLRRLSKKTATRSDDVVIETVQGIHVVVYSVAALYISLLGFEFSEPTEKTLDVVFYVVLTWQAIHIVSQLIKYFAETKLKDEDGDGEVDPNAATAAEMITLISRIALWIFGFLFVLSNLGIEITSLIAGLGIGGIAVAFALQGILSDLFASFSLYFDKPFRIGDHIMIGTDSGGVEKIGIKTTRIRTLQGEELVVSNAELTTTRVQNFKKMERRRGSSTFGVLYETPIDKLHALKTAIPEIFATIENADLNRVFFTTFGPSSLDFEVVFYVNSREYGDFLVVQEEFNFKLLEKMHELGIEFAYPTQTIYTKKD